MRSWTLTASLNAFCELCNENMPNLEQVSFDKANHEAEYQFDTFGDVQFSVKCYEEPIGQLTIEMYGSLTDNHFKYIVPDNYDNHDFARKLLHLCREAGYSREMRQRTMSENQWYKTSKQKYERLFGTVPGVVTCHFDDYVPRDGLETACQKSMKNYEIMVK